MSDRMLAAITTVVSENALAWQRNEWLARISGPCSPPEALVRPGVTENNLVLDYHEQEFTFYRKTFHE